LRISFFLQAGYLIVLFACGVIVCTWQKRQTYKRLKCLSTIFADNEKYLFVRLLLFQAIVSRHTPMPLCLTVEENYTPQGVMVVRMYLKYSISGVLFK